MLFRGWVANTLVSLLLASGVASAQTGASGTTASFRLLEATIDDAHASMKSGQITCRELIQLYLNRGL